MAELEAYPWPGNVRELRNVVERAVYRHEDPERPIDEIQFDPFHSPWAPADCRARPAAPATAAPTKPSAAPAVCAAPPAATNDFRAAVAAMNASCSRTRWAATASTSARPRRRSASATTSFVTRLKRHKLQDSAADRWSRSVMRLSKRG